MKKNFSLIPLSLIALLALVGCQSSKDFTVDDSIDPASGNVSGGGEHEDVTIDDTPEEPEVNNSGSFSLTAADTATGVVTQSGNVYTISAAGSYSAKGVLEDGQIIINVGDEDEVELELKGATISCSTDSPIKVLNADKLEISAKKNTDNKVIDARSEKSSTAVDDGSLGEGAINAKCDLKLKGAGTLVVEGNYNNGVHTTKDLTIQKETLHVTAVNNAFKGKNSITMVSGTVTAISKKGNGLKTDDTDLGSSGKQKGSITISGGTLVVDSAFDGIDAAYNAVINQDNEDSLDTKVTIKTGRYSTYSSNYSSDTSSKGIKADNQIDIAAGTIGIKATDDAIHANYGDSITSGGVGQGLINITGGNIGIASGDDGIHADNTLTINDGFVTITGAAEGLEANHIKINGGSTSIYGSDDGVNASKKINQTPSVEITGGFLDVAVSSGDTDGIDSNGTFKMTGGLVITRGGPGGGNRMSTGLDCDSTVSFSGGTIIAFNGMENKPTITSSVCYAYYGSSSEGGGPGGPGGPGGGGHPSVATSYMFQPGVYVLSGGDITKTFENEYNYSTFLVYSNEIVKGESYTLARDGTTLLSWTQSSQSQKIS